MISENLLVASQDVSPPSLPPSETCHVVCWHYLVLSEPWTVVFGVYSRHGLPASSTRYRTVFIGERWMASSQWAAKNGCT